MTETGPAGGAPSPATRSGRAAPGPGRRAWWVVLVLAALGAVSLALVWMLGGEPPPGDDEVDLVPVSMRSAYFGHPPSWSETSLSPSRDPVDPQIEEQRNFSSAATQDDVARALISYDVRRPPVPRPTTERIHHTIEEAVGDQREATQAELVDMRAGAGHGCVSGVEYAEGPEVFHGRGMVSSMQYRYTCESGEGPITGWYLVGYAPDGRAHRVTVTALSSYWEDERAELEAVIDSVHATTE